MTDAVSGELAKVRKSAIEERNAKQGMTRVTVQVGHCSLAVGAAEVVKAVEETLPEDAYLVVAGCDGACLMSKSEAVRHNRLTGSPANT